MPSTHLALSSLCLLLLVGACQSTPEEPVELQVGEGVIDVSTAPAGSEQCPLPQWGQLGFPGVGSELVFMRGDDVAHFRIDASPHGGWQMTDVATGVSQLLDENWADAGKDLPENAGPIQRLLPGDALVHYPLWVNKNWTADYFSHGMGRNPIHLRAEYQCDAREWVHTPAGKFNCYRIWRKVMLAEGVSEHRVSVYWYAPEVGFIVKRLDDSKLLELHQIKL